MTGIGLSSRPGRAIALKANVDAALTTSGKQALFTLGGEGVSGRLLAPDFSKSANGRIIGGMVRQLRGDLDWNEAESRYEFTFAYADGKEAPAARPRPDRDT